MKKMSIRDILNMFKWHPNYNFKKVTIRYIDRPKGTSTLKGEDIEDIGHKFIYLKLKSEPEDKFVEQTEVIPIHRITEIRYNNKVYWKKV